ncbi:MAG: glycosyltransferase family 1 protein [Nanoarchaeota archaeon]|nr:MAG: glycosyltransferase family 1 protein [Nanoarchaeota archaeon]
MKVLFVLENYLPHIGGVEVVFSQLAEGLAKQGHRITILTHRIKGTKKEETINGVKVVRVSCFGSRYLFSFFAIPKAINLAKDADIIHTTTFNGTLPAWKSGFFNRKPVIITVHEVWLDFWDELSDMNLLSRKLHAILEKLIYLMPFDKYIAVSEYTAKDLEKIGIPRKKITRIYNALDYDLFNPKKYSKNVSRKKLSLPNKFLYFGYGRPGVSKGFEYLIKAVPSVSKALPDSRLVLMLSRGEAYRKRFEELSGLAENLGIKDKIIFVESVAREKLPFYLSAMDCVVIPSLREGFGFTAAESCAMNVPVVATNATSLPEVVSGKYILVNPKDDKAIAKAVVAVSKNKYKTSKLKKFLLSENIKNYLDVYRKILNK